MEDGVCPPFWLERGRRIDPKYTCWFPPRVMPAVDTRALKIQRVARLQIVVLLLVQPHLELSFQDEQRLFSLMGIPAAAPSIRLDGEDLHLQQGARYSYT